MSGFTKLIHDELQEGVSFIFIRNKCFCTFAINSTNNPKSSAFVLSPSDSYEPKRERFGYEVKVIVAS